MYQRVKIIPRHLLTHSAFGILISLSWANQLVLSLCFLPFSFVFFCFAFYVTKLIRRRRFRLSGCHLSCDNGENGGIAAAEAGFTGVRRNDSNPTDRRSWGRSLWYTSQGGFHWKASPMEGKSVISLLDFANVPSLFLKISLEDLEVFFVYSLKGPCVWYYLGIWFEFLMLVWSLHCFKSAFYY